jgi:hypothetical protein
MTRPRSLSDPSSPSSPPTTLTSYTSPSNTHATRKTLNTLPSLPSRLYTGEEVSSHTTLSSIEDDLIYLALDENRHEASSQPHRHRPGIVRDSNTPSVTSVSDDEDVVIEVDEEVKTWMGKGKGKAVDSGSRTGQGLAATLPHEVLVHVRPLAYGHTKDLGR